MTRVLSCLAAMMAALVIAACGERDEPEVSASVGIQFDIVGSWHGELTQQGMKPFTVRATIASLERFDDNTVRYSGIDCSGTWEFLGAGETEYRFREVIDRGRSAKCKGSGDVSLTPLSDDELGYEFHGGGVVSSGDLQRVSPAKGG